MKVLSLFNGMSIGNMAIPGDYYIAEIDKHANKASEALFPNQIQLGSVLDWSDWEIDWGSIDLVMGGFPCQAWSNAGKQMGDKDPRGMLFWTMLEIMSMVKLHNHKAHFIIENVKMKSDFEKYITFHTEQALGDAHKVLINSALVSAQNRQRYYWTSFEVSQPEDRGIMLCDVLEDHVDDKFFISEKQMSRLDVTSLSSGGARICFQRSGQNVTKSECLSARDHKGISYSQYFTVSMTEKGLRKLTPREYMRLQTIPEHHIDILLNSGISNTQLYKMTGNAWTMEVIKHIWSCSK